MYFLKVFRSNLPLVGDDSYALVTTHFLGLYYSQCLLLTYLSALSDCYSCITRFCVVLLLYCFILFVHISQNVVVFLGS